MLNTLRIAVACFLIFTLAACGGGGSSKSGPKTQTITFASAEAAKLFIDDTTINIASGGAGSGAVSYSSDNTAVATVDDSGQVTAVALGTAYITASKAADAQYSAATARYRVDVATKNFTMTTWMGANNTELSFTEGTEGTEGIELYRSNDANCDITNYTSCANGQMNVLNGMALTDNAALVGQQGFYTFKHGNAEINAAVGERWSKRSEHQVVVFNNRLWIIGGQRGSKRLNDVWSSLDGVNWTQMTASAAFPARSEHQVVVFNDQLWVIAGSNPTAISSGKMNDVWSSSDGINWIQQTDNAGFSARSGHTATVFNNQMWVISGRDNPEPGIYHLKNDVWSSSDGITWTQQTDSANFSARYNAAATVFQSKLWIIGGHDGAFKNDVWASSDGITWTLQTGNADFPIRFKHEIIEFDNKLWVIAGRNSEIEALGDVWYSSDGINWIEQTNSAGFSKRYDFQAAAFNNKLWVIGGHISIYGDTGSGDTHTNDVWAYSDDLNWQLQNTPGHPFDWVNSTQFVTFNEQMWAIGADKVWSSDNGINWTLQTASAGFGARFGFQAIVFNNRLWVIAGSNGTSQNDVWSSSDGINWVLQTNNAGFSPRWGHRVAVFDNQLWVIGSHYYTMDVWSSSDGITWTRLIAELPFSRRNHFSLTAFDGKLWLIGGRFTSYFNEVWSSSDGITWTLQTNTAPFAARHRHQVVVHNNQLWLSGGLSDASYKNDIWSSTNGIDWNLQSASAAFSKRVDHQTVSFDNQLWLLGGNDDNTLNDVWRSEDGVNWKLGSQRAFSFP